MTAFATGDASRVKTVNALSETYPEGFCYRSTYNWIPNSYLKSKTKTLKVILKELSPKIMSNTTDKYLIITFSIVNNPNPHHP